MIFCLTDTNIKNKTWKKKKKKQFHEFHVSKTPKDVFKDGLI
jgi:hypothetical protein